MVSGPSAFHAGRPPPVPVTMVIGAFAAMPRWASRSALEPCLRSLLCIGIVVDDAIIVVEGAVIIEQGMTRPCDAAIRAMDAKPVRPDHRHPLVLMSVFIRRRSCQASPDKNVCAVRARDRRVSLLSAIAPPTLKPTQSADVAAAAPTPPRATPNAFYLRFNSVYGRHRAPATSAHRPDGGA